jgi:hypothetical protein
MIGNSRYPDIKKFIVQDLPATREAAESLIVSKGLTDRVEFEEQDFFKPQQRKGKYVFVMQRGLYVIHDQHCQCLMGYVFAIQFCMIGVLKTVMLS